MLIKEVSILRLPVFPLLFLLVLLPATASVRADVMIGVVNADAPVVAAETAALPVMLPANTVVQLQTVDPVGSKTSKSGDAFRLRLSQPVFSGGKVMIAVDTPVMGEVVHAARSGIGGKAGELVLAARYIDAPQGKIRLRSTLSAAGKDNTDAALAAALLTGGLGVIIRGKEVELPAGSLVSARLATEVVIIPLP